jgi:PBP1b-binding outer membrane lipoprotein LpoB
MFKSHMLFSIALGGLVLAGCNKDENPAPVAVPPATAPTTVPATLPSLPSLPPVTLPATLPGAASDAIDSGKAAAADADKKVGDVITKTTPATLPSVDSK